MLVANGHHWDPRWPEPSFAGSDTFPGEQIHAHYYRVPEELEGKRVVVLGIGNSATDIAVESSQVAAETYLAMRRGAHIVPKFVFGKATDQLTSSPLARAPHFVQKKAMKAMLRLAVGKVTDYGLPEPDHDVLDAHPTVSDDLLTRLGHGDITVKPNIDRFEGSKVFFTDGTAVEADVVVYCTGYRISFPFLDESIVGTEDNHVDLYRRVVPPGHPGLYFIGLLQPLGAIMPLAEAQSHWVAELITGEVALPSVAEMREQIAAYDAALRRRYVASKRHTIQVDALRTAPSWTGSVGPAARRPARRGIPGRPGILNMSGIARPDKSRDCLQVIQKVRLDCLLMLAHHDAGDQPPASPRRSAPARCGPGCWRRRSSAWWSAASAVRRPRWCPSGPGCPGAPSCTTSRPRTTWSWPPSST